MDGGLFSCDASVFLVEDEYQICVLVEATCTMWVEVAGRTFHDASNGILRSGRFVHIAHVPQRLLDETGGYAVHLRRLRERKPYFTDYGEVESRSYPFRPLREKEEYHLVNLADAHSLVEEPIASGSYFGDDLDLLVLNGDIPNHSDEIRFFRSIYLISGAVSRGRIPCVFSRGNHDLRGAQAERLEDFTPTAGGRSYFTFRAGPVWGIVLDEGEDKPDSVPNYGHTVCCDAFRDEEEDFLEKVVARGESLDAPVRLVICHMPIAYKRPGVPNFDEPRLRRWTERLNRLRPTVMLSGHLHTCFLDPPGGEHDSYGLSCPVVCSSRVRLEPPFSHTSGAILLRRDEIEARFVNDRGETEGSVVCPVPH